MSDRNFYVGKTSLQFGLAGLFLLFCLCSYLFFVGESVAVAALLFVIVCFLPIFFLSRQVKSPLLQLVVGIALVTQLISVPLFVINRDNYAAIGWNAVKDFTFTFPEFAGIYALLAFFLLVLVSCVAFLIGVFKLPELIARRNAEIPKRPSAKTGRFGYFLMLLIIAIIVNIPLDLWMFSNGIGLVGIEPPALPFRLSGILYYLTHFIVPVSLGMLYAKTSRGFTPGILLAGYALMLGAAHISKSSVLLMMLPVLYFSMLDRKYVLLGVSALLTLTAIQVVTLLRGVVYIIDAGKSGADSASGLVDSLTKLTEVGVEEISLVDTFSLLVSRVEGAQDIVLSSKFNLDAVGGIGQSFQRFFYDQWIVIDPDIYHTELIGMTLPEGFAAGGGGLLSKSLLMTNSNPIYIAIFALIVAAFIVIGEWLARTISVKYATPAFYYMAGGLYILFYYTGSGTTVFWGLLMLQLLIVLMPKFNPVAWRRRSS